MQNPGYQVGCRVVGSPPPGPLRSSTAWSDISHVPVHVQLSSLFLDEPFLPSPMNFVFRAQVPQPRADRPCRSRYRPLTARPRRSPQATGWAPGHLGPRPSTPARQVTPPLLPFRPLHPLRLHPLVFPLSFHPSGPVVFSTSESYSLLSGSNSRFFLLLHSHLSHSLEQSSTFSSSSFCPISCHNLSLSLPILNSNFIVAAHLSLCAVVSLYQFPRRPSSTLDFELQPVAITVALLRLSIGIALV